MKIFLILMTIMLIGISSSFAQKQAVMSALAKYKLDESILNPNVKAAMENYYFDSRRLSITRDDQKTEVARHDPSKPAGQRWILVSVNGQSPSRKEQAAFDKEHNQVPPKMKIDEGTMKLESDGQDRLVISYKYDPSSVPEESSFIKDCRAYQHINTKTGLLEKSATKNEKPLKIKVVNVPALNSEVNYTYDTDAKSYFIQNEKIAMTIKLLGIPVNSLITTEYTNYKK